MENEVKEIRFREIEYDILEVSYYINDIHPFDFYVSATVKVPDDLYPDGLRFGLPLHTALPFVERQDAGMAKYVEKTIAEFSDQPNPELSAFQTLEEEGFDLELFLRHTLSGINVKMEEVEETEEETPKQTSIVFSKIKYAILSYEYVYNEEVEPREFNISLDLQMPKIYFPEGLSFDLPLDTILKAVTMEDANMVEYVKKVVADFEGQRDAELLAFQSLEEEGFDVPLFLDYMLRNLTMNSRGS